MRSSAEIAALSVEVAKCLQLVVPASMTQDDRKAWILAAVDALEDITAQEVARVSAEIRRSVTRPSQIVPEIAKLVAEKRKFPTAGGYTAMDYYHRARENDDYDKAALWLAEARKRGEIIDPSEPRS